MSSTSHLPFSTYASSSPAPPASSTSFTLTANPTLPTDIWRKPGPPPIKTFNAPLIYKSIPLRTFQRARITVSAPWSRLYDQGGLVFILRDPAIKKDEDQKWIKTGVEFYQGEVFVSTVAADAWADWSLVQVGIQGGDTVTLELERQEVDDTLWIFVVDEGAGKRIPIREVTWVLSEPADTEVWVGVYTATPKTDGKELEVKFEGWELEVRK